MQYSIQIEELENRNEGYNGEVVYTQENMLTEESCIITYPHKFYKDLKSSPIYSYHTKEKERVTFLSSKKQEDWVLVCDGGADWPNAFSPCFYRMYSLFGIPFLDCIFHAGKEEEEIDTLILSRGFSILVPSLLLDVYNEDNAILKLLSEIVLQAREIDDKKCETKRMLVQIKQD